MINFIWSDLYPLLVTGIPGQSIRDMVKPENIFYEEGEFCMMADFEELVRGDRVRENTSPKINEAIDREIAATVRFYAGKTDYEISKRIEELNNEWDIGRHVEARAAIISIIGLVLGLKKGRKWLILPLIAATFLLQYALQGWAPPIPVLRRFGIRTKQEIDMEKYALKALRGDFDEVPQERKQAVQQRLPMRVRVFKTRRILATCF